MTPLQISGVQYIQAATAIRAATDSRISAEAFSSLIAGIVDVSIGAKTPEQLINEVLAVNSK
jgi:raffinose/stachyose/melibiose transport system substrate-binding protein